MTSAPEASVEVELRQRQPSDIPILCAILTAVHAEKGYPVDGPPFFDEFLNPPPDHVLHTIVAVLRRRGPADTKDGEVVGHAMLMLPTAGGGNDSESTLRTQTWRLGCIWNGRWRHGRRPRRAEPLLRQPEGAQARGIGTKMLEEAVAWGGREGRMVVLVVLEKDARAVRLYDHAAGWVRVGERDVFTSRWGDGYNAPAYLGPALSRASE